MKEQIKHIEQLAEDILQEYTNCYSEVDKEVLTKMIYNAGYRKVIHCKDCAYRDTEGCPNTYWSGGELESNVEDDSFCSGAKMKGGAE